MPHKIKLDEDYLSSPGLHDLDLPRSENGQVWSLLETACAQDDLDTVREIIQSRGLEPLGCFLASAVVAIEMGNENIVAALVKAGLPVDGSVVRTAVQSSKKYQYLQLSIAHKWDVTSQLTSHTPSVLALAAEAGDLKLVQWLLQEQHAAVNVQCEQLRTPLSVALQHAPDAIVDTMFEHDVCVAKGQLMHHALWCALKQPVWDTRLMDMLIDRGASISNKMYDGDIKSEMVHQMQTIPFGTPLHVAVEAKRRDAVEYLRQRGARSDVPNQQNKTALQVATREIRQLLGDQEMD